MSKRKLILLLIGLLVFGLVAGYAAVKQKGWAEVEKKDEAVLQNNPQSNIVRVKIPEGVTKEDVAEISKHKPITRAPGEKDLNEISKKIDQAIKDEFSKIQPAIQKDNPTRAQNNDPNKPDQPMDYIVILVDKDGDDILPDLEEARQKQATRAFEENKLTFTWDSEWPELYLNYYKPKLEGAYPEMKKIYGPPFFSNNVLIKKSDRYNGNWYSPSKNEIYFWSAHIPLNPTNPLSSLLHEVFHAFRDDLVSLGVWEEGMVETATTKISHLMDIMSYYNLYYGDYESYNIPSFTPRYFEDGNWFGIGLIDDYMSSEMWYKILIEKEDFLKDFNRRYFDFYSMNNLFPISDSELSYWHHLKQLDMMKSVINQVEGLPVEDWLDRQMHLNRNTINTVLFLDISTYLQKASLSASENFLNFYLAPDRAKRFKHGENIKISVFDSMDQKVLEKEFGSRELKNLPIYDDIIAPLIDKDLGRIKIVAEAEIDGQKLTETKYYYLDNYYQSEEYPIFSYYRKGIWGIVEDENEGNVTITKIEPNSNKTLKLLVQKGVFNSSGAVNNFSKEAGQFRIEFENNNGKKNSKIINKDSTGYYVVMSDTEKQYPVSPVMFNENDKTLSWDTENSNLSKIVLSQSNTSLSSSSPWIYGNIHKIKLEDLPVGIFDSYQIVVLDNWGNLQKTNVQKFNKSFETLNEKNIHFFEIKPFPVEHNYIKIGQLLSIGIVESKPIIASGGFPAFNLKVNLNIYDKYRKLLNQNDALTDQDGIVKFSLRSQPWIRPGYYSLEMSIDKPEILNSTNYNLSIFSDSTVKVKNFLPSSDLLKSPDRLEIEFDQPLPQEKANQISLNLIEYEKDLKIEGDESFNNEYNKLFFTPSTPLNIGKYKFDLYAKEENYDIVMPFTAFFWIINDTVNPSLSHTPPSSPQPPTQDLKLSANITDNSGTVKEAKIYFRNIRPSKEWTEVPMAKKDGDNWEGVIAKKWFLKNSNIEYYLSAKDEVGNQAISPEGAPEKFHAAAMDWSGQQDQEKPIVISNLKAATGDNGVAVSYNLSGNATVSANIKTLAGKTVKTLLNNVSQNQGENKTNWNGRDDKNKLAAKGTYLVEVSARKDQTAQPIVAATRLTLTKKDISKMKDIKETGKTDNQPPVITKLEVKIQNKKYCPQWRGNDPEDGTEGLTYSYRMDVEAAKTWYRWRQRYQQGRWSDWTAEASKCLTVPSRLKGYTYNFFVRAKDKEGAVSKIKGIRIKK